VEDIRLSAICHNTLVTHNFLDDNIISVPDGEGRVADLKSLMLNKNIKSSTKKRKRTEKSSPTNKKQNNSKYNQFVSLQPSSVPLLPYIAGLKWDSINYSCAYDVILMFVYHSLWSISQRWRTAFGNSNTETDRLLRLFNRQDDIMVAWSCGELTELRDRWRYHLNNLSVSSFNNRGPRLISVESLCQVLGGSHENVVRDVCTCVFAIIDCRRDLWSDNCELVGLSPTALTASSQSWLAAAHVNGEDLHSRHCNDKLHIRVDLPTVMFVVHAMTVPALLPSLNLTFGGNSYELKSVVYFKDNHFYCRLVDSETHTAWTHDGMVNDGILCDPQRLHNTNNEWLMSLRNGPAYILFYNLI
jgi:hypothetical protein